MAPKLYKVADNVYVVADDIFIQRGEFFDGSEASWIASKILEEKDLLDLISGEMELSEFELDAELAKPLREFMEIPRDQWEEILKAMQD